MPSKFFSTARNPFQHRDLIPLRGKSGPKPADRPQPPPVTRVLQRGRAPKA